MFVFNMLKVKFIILFMNMEHLRNMFIWKNKKTRFEVHKSDNVEGGHKVDTI